MTSEHKTIPASEINKTIAELLGWELLPSDSNRVYKHDGRGYVDNFDFERDPRGTMLLQKWLHGHYSYFSVTWNGSGIEVEASGRNIGENFGRTWPLMDDGAFWVRAFLRANHIQVEE